MNEPKKKITLPIPATEDDPVQISIDRSCKKYSVFDNHWHCLMDFLPYETEAAAEAAGRQWILENIGDVPVRLIYPNITRMTVTTRRVKRTKA